MTYDPHDDQRGTWPKPRKLPDGTTETLSAFLERVAVEEYGLPPSGVGSRMTWQERQKERPFERRMDDIFRPRRPALDRQPGEDDA